MKIVVSNKFKRSFRKLTRRNTKLQRRIEEVISKLSEDVWILVWELTSLKVS